MNLLTGRESRPEAAWAARHESAILLDQVSVRYRVPHERYATLKEHAIRRLQRRVQFDDFWALRDVNLQVSRGEVLGIVGRNGAGKSTLLKVIARVLRPSQGRVRIRGRVAPLLEFGAGFHPELSGRENVFLNGALLGFSHAEMRDKFERIVEFAELQDFIDAPLRTYSSGMTARLGFAIATDVRPDILIIDEALSVGDAAFQKRSAERIEAFREVGATILLVSHSLEAIRRTCDRAIWLERGRVLADGTPEAVLERYQSQDASAEAKRLVGSAGPKADQRWGSRTIEIVGVRLLNSGGAPQTVFATGESLYLEMDYVAHEPVPAPMFGMAIHRNDGTHICGPNTAFAGLTLPTLEGTGTITYTIPCLTLLEGLYQISVAVMNQDDTQAFDYHDRCYPFRVENANGRIQERYGLVTLQGEWKHRPSELRSVTAPRVARS